jgi:hypothetical protein
VRVVVAIERPDGRLVDSLLEARYPAVPVKPNAIKAWREAEVLSGAKSDPGDAADVSAAALTEKRLAAFCAKQGYSGKKPASVLLARLRSAPPGSTDPILT